MIITAVDGWFREEQRDDFAKQFILQQPEKFL